MPTCPGTGKMPKLTCDKELEQWQTRCNECTKRIKAWKQRKKEKR